MYISCQHNSCTALKKKGGGEGERGGGRGGEGKKVTKFSLGVLPPDHHTAGEVIILSLTLPQRQPVLKTHQYIIKYLLCYVLWAQSDKGQTWCKQTSQAIQRDETSNVQLCRWPTHELYIHSANEWLLTQLRFLIRRWELVLYFCSFGKVAYAKVFW